MPVRRLSLAISPLLRLADWLFSGAATGWDCLYLLGASWWLFMMLARPEIFDVPPLAGMTWAPDSFWVVFVASVVVMHGLALWRTGMYRLRMAAAMVSAWYWLTVSFSLSRNGLTTGSGFYAIVGLSAVMLTIYLSGRVAHRD